MKRKNKVVKLIRLENFEVIMTKGINKMISTSKIKNIILIKKNWILKGGRLSVKGSNPHSKGEDFSKFLDAFFERDRPRKVRIKGKVKIKILKVLIIIIIYIKGLF